jgi:hypothetical protein
VALETLRRQYMARLLHDARTLLAGPPGLGLGMQFWGRDEFVLRREADAFVSGVAETRCVYSNLWDKKQKQAILRQAIFDAREARLAVLTDFERLGTACMPCPIIALRYVWLDISWLQAALDQFGEYSVPLGAKIRRGSGELRSVFIERPDGSAVEVRWRAATVGVYKALSATWLRVWDQMSDALLNAETVEPEEHWPPNCPPEHRRVDALKLLLQEGPDGSPSAILDESQT